MKRPWKLAVAAAGMPELAGASAEAMTPPAAFYSLHALSRSRASPRGICRSRKSRGPYAENVLASGEEMADVFRRHDPTLKRSIVYLPVIE